MQLLKRILQAIQNSIDLFTSDNQRRFNANDPRVIERTGNEYTTLEEARRDSIADVVIHKMLTYKQAFAGNICVHVIITRSDLSQPQNEVFALFSSLFRHTFFECHIDSG